MTAPERFADSQIPLAPRAPSIHDPGCVKTLGGITAPGILGPTVMWRAKKNAKICLPLGITTKSDFVFTRPRPISDILASSASAAKASPKTSAAEGFEMVRSAFRIRRKLPALLQRARLT
jgi:hypothetical protein